jgi:hypothetical protein
MNLDPAILPMQKLCENQPTEHSKASVQSRHMSLGRDSNRVPPETKPGVLSDYEVAP